jgi:hypothetical protein
MSTFATNSVQKGSKLYKCELCDYNTSRQSQYTRHLETEKHLKRINATIINELITNSVPLKFSCDICSKTYKERTGLWRHKKTCTYEPEPVAEPIKKPKLYEKEDILDVLMKENLDFKNIILEVVKNNAELQKQNQDFQKQIMELYKTGNNTVISNNNSHNKTFNMQFFLNETCKDAMNIKDFVNSMTLELEDLEEVGKLGYVEGISNIIIRKLNALDVYKRPIHCSDAKREIMFVKDDNIWEKENCTYDKLRKAIKSVTYKNSALLGPWSEKYPNCLNNQHHLNDVYVQMLGQAMGGKESFLESENKIMKKIAKAVLIEKKL